MAKSIIQKHTDPLSRECYLCRKEADEKGYFGELKHTGLHKHHFMHGPHRKKAEHMYAMNGITNMDLRHPT